MGLQPPKIHQAREKRTVKVQENDIDHLGKLKEANMLNVRGVLLVPLMVCARACMCVFGAVGGPTPARALHPLAGGPGASHHRRSQGGRTYIGCGTMPCKN